MGTDLHYLGDLDEGTDRSLWESSRVYNFWRFTGRHTEKGEREMRIVRFGRRKLDREMGWVSWDDMLYLSSAFGPERHDWIGFATRKRKTERESTHAQGLLSYIY